MRIDEWIDKNAQSLCGKTVAITGTTGGLGREICAYLASLGADLILLDRNDVTSEAHKDCLLERYPDICVNRIHVDLENMESVRSAIAELKIRNIDIFIHNAGAYSIPRHACDTGFDNVFQINFVSPYYMIRELLPQLRTRCGKVVAVGSIAHNYSKIDANDVDFRTRKAASKVYGNAKRYLMFSLTELLKSEKDVRFSIVHPGITLTNITAHYPKWIYAIIKYPMKVIFMSPRKAALCIVKGLFDSTAECEWIGPRILNVWGIPKKKKLLTCGERERKYIFDTAQDIYARLNHI